MNKEIAPVLDEISETLKKHDMTGLVIIGNKTHCDWRMKVEASWSCAWLEETPQGVMLRIRSKREDFLNGEEQKKCLEATLGTFVTMHDTLMTLREQLEKILVMVAHQVDFIGKSTDE